MDVGHKDRSTKVAWDVEMYAAVVRFSMKYERDAIRLSMLQ